MAYESNLKYCTLNLDIYHMLFCRIAYLFIHIFGVESVIHMIGKLCTLLTYVYPYHELLLTCFQVGFELNAVAQANLISLYLKSSCLNFPVIRFWI